MSDTIKLINFNREIVMKDYESCSIQNSEAYIRGDVTATREYVFINQKTDAIDICDKFYRTDTRAVSIIKRTKAGMDGLMIEIAKNMSTHSDDNFVINRHNIFIITGMSNKDWEDNMKNSIPSCFVDNVFHHGKLQILKKKIKNIENALLIIDEIDSGDKENQKLHKILKESNILDMKYMDEKNIRFVFASATNIKELKDLYEWGDKHHTHHMTIPNNYIGPKDFLQLGFIKEYYEINSTDTAEKWVKEDILQNYSGDDCRIHIIRTDKDNVHYIESACSKYKVGFRNHTSTDRLSHEELESIFNIINKHKVIAIKGFLRRANLIPNQWKMKIGATHEKYVKNRNTSVQIQGLPGRMSGYWKEEIMNGHKTGPHRTSIDSINEYEEFYKNPYGEFKYNTHGSKKLFVNKDHIENFEGIQRKESTYKRIPIIIDNINKNAIIFNKIKKSEKKSYVLSILNNEKYSKLYNFIDNNDVISAQITRPTTDSSYKKHITDVVNANTEKKPFIIDLQEKNKNKNNWQLFIDDREYRLCFVIWCIDDLYNDDE